MIYLVMAVFFFIFVVIVGLILLQEGKGGGIAGMGGATMDGVMGVRNPLRRWTAYAFIFFVLITLGFNWYLTDKQKSGITDKVYTPADLPAEKPVPTGNVDLPVNPTATDMTKDTPALPPVVNPTVNETKAPAVPIPAAPTPAAPGAGEPTQPAPAAGGGN